jgi:hypothetical protein
MIKRIVSNGCSWMEGMGVTSQDGQGGKLRYRLSALFAKRYSAKDINLSIPGGSNDRILRTTIDWFTKNKTLNHNETFVLIGLTQPQRTEMYYNETNSYIKIRASDMEYWKENFSEDHEDMMKLCNLKFKYAHSHQDDYERLMRMILGMCSVCEYYGAKYLITDAYGNIKDWEERGHAYPLLNKGDINKRSSAEFFDGNPNIYLENSWVDLLGAPSRWNKHYDESDLGHPNTKGNEEWFKHLIKYIKKNNII